jgi:hypothetical protein
MRKKRPGKFLGPGGRNAQARRAPAGVWRNTERTAGILFYELGAGHTARGDSDRREDGARDGEQKSFQSRGGSKANTSGKRMGDGKPVSICLSTGGRKKQRNNGDAGAFGTDSNSRMYYHGWRDGLPV